MQCLSQPVRASTCSKLILELTCHLKKNNDNKVLQSESGHPNPSPVSIYGAPTEVQLYSLREQSYLTFNRWVLMGYLFTEQN